VHQSICSTTSTNGTGTNPGSKPFFLSAAGRAEQYASNTIAASGSVDPDPQRIDTACSTRTGNCHAVQYGGRDHGRQKAAPFRQPLNSSTYSPKRWARKELMFSNSL